MLTAQERKDRLPYGALSRAAEHFDLSPSRLTRILNGARDERVEVWLAKRMDPPISAEEAFGPPRRIMRRRKPRTTQGASR